MRVTIMQVECDVCNFLSPTYDMALMSLSDVISDLKEKGWFRARGSCQDLCPGCNRKADAFVSHAAKQLKQVQP